MEKLDMGEFRFVERFHVKRLLPEPLLQVMSSEVRLCTHDSLPVCRPTGAELDALSSCPARKTPSPRPKPGNSSSHVTARVSRATMSETFAPANRCHTSSPSASGTTTGTESSVSAESSESSETSEERGGVRRDRKVLGVSLRPPVCAEEVSDQFDSLFAIRGRAGRHGGLVRSHRGSAEHEQPCRLRTELCLPCAVVDQLMRRALQKLALAFDR